MRPELRERVRPPAQKGLLLDTDVLINILKHIPGYASLFHRQSRRLYYASISKKELYGKHGLTRSEAIAIAELLTKIRKVDLDRSILRRYDSLLRRYHHRRLLKADALIAATAWAKGLILITGNVTDFSFIEEIQVVSPDDLPVRPL
ncbi:MAG: PIN domain-containing protein [Nitrospirae bacterium]|nr:PIN domain-containing protein [Nitrospirota bacterium]